MRRGPVFLAVGVILLAGAAAGLELAAELAAAVEPLVSGLVIAPAQDPVATVRHVLAR